jgi:hypothetical protein
MAKQRQITYKVNENGCHICISHRPDVYGYPRINVNGKTTLIHRYIYETHKGLIEEGNVIRHTCDIRKCINPEHLIEGTKAENSQDMVERDRVKITKGIDCYNSKLNEQQVIEIFTNTTNTVKELSQKYKVNMSSIRQIRLGMTWKHLTKTL